MRALTYTGRSRYRELGKADGLTADRRFERDVPLEVSEEDAELILGEPDRFPSFVAAGDGDPGDRTGAD